jgi:hypothetical protein
VYARRGAKLRSDPAPPTRSRETEGSQPRTSIMGHLLMDLVKLECRIAGLAAAAGLPDEAAQAMARADHYLRLRATERRGTADKSGGGRWRLPAWLRGGG